MNPKKALEYYSRVYPSAWKQVDAFRAARGKDLPWWPDWCFCPLAGAYAIVSAETGIQKIDVATLGQIGLELIEDVGRLGALAAWRATQGVYRFDPDVYQTVIDTPLSGNIPHDVFFNLPEWCVYIETPNMILWGMPLAGFFAHLEYDVNYGHTELRLLLDYHALPNDRAPRLVSIVLHLGPWSIKESLKKACDEAELYVGRVMGFTDDDEHANLLVDYITPLVSLLLYICSVNGEIGDGESHPVKPKAKKTKKGPRMFPPPKVTTWNVGVRMGAALRRAKEAAYRDTDTGERRHASPRPHYRRAHWHGYWTGPREGNRKFILKWLSPILVAGKDDDLPVTIRPVEK